MPKLSQSQLGIYFACRALEPGDGNYQVPLLYRLPESIDTDRLANAIGLVVQAHPYILSRISEDNGIPYTSIKEFEGVRTFRIKSIDEARPGFCRTTDLLTEPLFRFEIYLTDNGNWLYIDFHHIIIDGSSFTTLRKEIERAYDSGKPQGECFDGGMMAEEEEAKRNSDIFEEQKKWYRDNFSAAADLDSAPIPSAAEFTASSSEPFETDIRLRIGKSYVSGLCARYNVGKSVIFTAAWGKLLANYGARDNAFFTTIWHGRTEKTMNAITMAVRTLPVYMEMPSGMETGEWLQAISTQQHDTREKDAYSFSDIHEDLGLRDGLTFAYQGTLASDHHFPIVLDGHSIDCEDLRIPIPGVTLDAQVFEIPGEEGDYVIRLSSRRNIYTEKMLQEMAEAYSAIINSLMNAGKIKDIEAASRAQIAELDKFNPVGIPDSGDYVINKFRKIASRLHDKVFCVCGDESLTYSEVDRLTDRLALAITEKLAKSGVRAGEGRAKPVAGVIADRNVLMVISPIAIVKAGCTYLPLDSSYPKERLAYMIKDAGASVVLTQHSHLGLLEDFDGQVLAFDNRDGIPEPETETVLPALSQKDDDTFILLYTSGTTGSPKGVMLTERNIRAFCDCHCRRVELTEDSRSASYASFGFDGYMMDLWMTATSGSTLYIIEDSIRFDLVGIKEMFDRNRITHAFMTTQVATQMAIDFPRIDSLKYLYMGGEKMTAINPPEYKVINMYGPTENTAYVTSFDVVSKLQNIPIGKTTGCTRIYIVSKDGQRLPVGAAGEMWCSGAQTAKGYLNLPEKTAESFIPNPFAGPEDADKFPTVYRTGDIVRFREDNEIEFIGRRDGQVKIRGFRVELKEVEAVILDFPGIREATVQAFDSGAGGKMLAAYIVAGGHIEINELNAFIEERKPPYMVPAVTMQIERIPLNINGKVDKKKLPEPKLEISGTEAHSTPLNTLEQELMDMVKPLCDNCEFGITTPLKYTGLTSISSIKLSALLYKKYGINVTNKELTHSSTIQSIENAILEKLLLTTRQENPDADQNITGAKQEIRGGSKDILRSAPLTGAQLGVYYECLKNPESTVYNIPQIIRFPENISSGDLKDAVCKVLALHPLFFSRIDNSVDPPVQRRIDGAEPEVVVSGESPETIRENFVQPFDLSTGPLYRAVISGSSLFFDAHHIIMDGSSLSLFISQVCDSLEGRDIKPESCDYFKYASGEAKKDRSREEAFFTAKLSSVEEAVSIPASLHGDEKAGREAEAVDIPDHAAVEQYARKAGVTPAAVYLAAVSYTAARYANTRDVCLCTVSSGRSDVRIAESCGMFVNTLALTAHIAGQSVAEYIREAAETLVETMGNEGYPFARVADKFGLDPGLVFVYQPGVIESYSAGGREVRLESLELSAPKFKLSLLVEEHDSRVVIVARYNDALYTREAMDGLLESIVHVIGKMVAAPEAPVAKLEITSERQRMQVETMSCCANYDLPVRVLHKGIESWAEKTPDATALMASDAVLSYRELDKAACIVANALIRRGLQKGDAVIALLPRNSRTIVSLFGIMKAGGAFIPCDPEYPTERIKHIADDSAARFIITDKGMCAAYGERGISVDELFEDGDDRPVDAGVTPDDLAYMIYTSGSTGVPKGVRVAHKNITTLFNVREASPLWPLVSECRRMCSVSTISFDAFIFDFGMSLFNGLCLIFTSETESKDPFALARVLNTKEADYFSCTSSRMLQYLELPDFVDAMRRCRVFIQGGEKFSDILLKKLRDLNSGLTILNGYGPTEVSIACNYGALQNSSCIHVGKPIPNYREWIMDKDGNELPVGVVGELCVGGEGVTLGYNNLPEKTAEKYFRYRGMNAFRTGDYAKWLPGGEVEILGRTDNQVKLRGLRIELGEVENAISKVEGIKNVYAKICRIQERDHLSAYFTADREIDIEKMKEEIGKTLTAYMVPTAYLQMDVFPISPNGKIDFRHLPEPELCKSSSEYVRPENRDEKFFADCFAEILGLDKVGATDSFFSLGGTSLVVMKLIIEAQSAGYKVTYADVFANPTPRDLARFAGDGAAADGQEDPDADISDYDYTSIDEALKHNSLESFLAEPGRKSLGKVLLTGATGFLGIHILRCLIEEHPEVEIHCLLRSKHGVPPEDRLRQILFYYFEDEFSEKTAGRLFVHEGDVTEPIAIESGIDTVINCAAIVKHFANGNIIGKVNVEGVRNCVDFCLSRGARMIQVSTYSVGGASVNGKPSVKVFDERMLYVGQRLHNQYIHSKILGERIILEAVATKGLDGKIMRVGNLSARSEDGEFQINVKANSFMGRLRIYQMLGVLPYSDYQSSVEFSPIDETARAICLLAGTAKGLTVFHPYNSHFQMLGDVLKEMKSIGRDVRLVENEEFVRILNEAKSDSSKQESLSAMLAYETKPGTEFVQVIPSDNSYTLQVLLRLGFRWNTTSWDYIDQFLHQIDTLQYFDEK